jgi:hypothetical protein
MNLSEAIDLQVFNTIRMDTIQEVINMYMMENPPQNPVEYKMGMFYIMETITTCQPNAFNDVPLPQKFVVVPSCTLRPIELIDRWIRLALLAIAVNDYDGADFYFAGALETVMQFRDDELLLLATKLSFPVGVRAIYDEGYAKRFATTCRICVNIILTHNKDSKGTIRESFISHCGNYYMLLDSINEWIMKKTPNGKLNALGCSGSIDAYNNKRFDMANWTIFQLL